MRKYFWLILIIILGVVLRFYHNLQISLWHDEAFSALMIRYPWGEMFYRLGLDVHPPMYYIFLRFWHNIFGDSLLSLRGFSIFCGTATIPVAYLFVKEAFAGSVGSPRETENLALWAALLVAINPFQLQYVTEARMYTMGALFAMLSAYFLVRALHLQKELHESEKLNMPNLSENIRSRRQMIWNFVGFTLSMIVIIYTHYYLFFTASAIGLYGLVYLYLHHGWNLKKFRPLLISFVVIILSFLPWLKTFLFQLKQVQQSYWIGPMTVWSMPSTFWDMLLGFARDTNKSSTQQILVAITLFTIYLFYSFLKRTDAKEKLLVTFAVAAPFLGAMAFAVLSKLKGSSSSVYLDRYFLFASIFFSVAVAVWLKEIKYKWLSVFLLVVYCLLNLTAYARYWSDLNVQSKPGMAAAAKFMENNVESTHKIFVGSSFMFFNFKYYWTQKINNCPGSSSCTQPVLDPDTSYAFNSGVYPKLFTGGVSKASEISHFAGSALLSDSDLLPDFKTAVHSGDTVWLLWTNGFGANKPEVPSNWVQIDEKGYAEVRPYAGTWVIVTEYRVN